MPFVERAGNPRLHFRIDDFTDPWRKARTIVLQHGYGRSSRFWDAWVPYLSRFYRIVRPDLRGHGESPLEFDPLRESTLDRYVGDLLSVLDELKLDSVHYCGESFGGILGMALAAERPALVRTLTLISTPVYQNEQSQLTFAAGYGSREEALRTKGSLEWARMIYGAKGFFPEGTDPGLCEWYVNEIGKTNPEVLCGLYGLLRNLSAQQLLPRIQAPVLGLYPTGGSMTSTEQEELLVRGIRNLRTIHMQTPSHAILTLFPEACAGHVLHFAAQYDGVPCRE